MGKRHNNIDDVEDYGSYEIMQPDSYGGAPQIFDPTYQPIDVEQVNSELHEKSKSVVTEIINVYFQAGEIEKPKYVETLQQIESMNLENMLVQVKYAGHMIQSLMRRLNEAGTLDSQLFRLIMDAQNHALQLTMTVANYVRNLPQYFKGLKFELLPQIPSIIPGDPMEQGQLGTDAMNIEDEGFINRPQMGTRDLIRCIELAEKQAKEHEKMTNEIDPTNYSPDATSNRIIEDQAQKILNDNAEMFDQPSGIEAVPPEQIDTEPDKEEE